MRDARSADNAPTPYEGNRTKPNPNQPTRCPSIDPYDTLQCGRRIHDDGQCQFGGIAWRKGTRPPHEKHRPWGPLEAALVATLADWKVESDARPASGEGSDCSDLMDLALTRIKGLCSRALDPEAVVAEIEGDRRIPPAQHCACGSPDTYSLNPAEVVTHSAKVCRVSPVSDGGAS